MSSDDDYDRQLDAFDLRSASTATERRRTRSMDSTGSGGEAAMAREYERLTSGLAAIIRAEQPRRRPAQGQPVGTGAAVVHHAQPHQPPHSSATRHELPESSPAPHPPTERNSNVGFSATPFAGHPSATRYRRDADGNVRSVRSGRNPSLHKWEFFTYDHEWATRGLPFTSDLLPPGVQYICGKPERNTTADRDGTPKQHFQGLVVFTAPRTAAQVGATLGLTQCSPIPLGNEMVTKRVDYTKKEDTAVLDVNGQNMWREAGVVPDNLKRSGDKHRELLECVKNGGTEMDVLEMHPQLGIQYFGNFTRMIGIYSKPVDRTDLQVYVIFGKTRVGKSHFVRRILLDGDNSTVFNKPHPANPMATDFWPLNYGRSTRVLFDDWHPKKYNITDMLNYLQEYAMSVAYKGGYMPACWNRIYITTNVPIDQWYDHLPESYKGNVEALKARIPEANRMTMRRRPPPEMTATTFAEMKRYQDGFAAEDEKEKEKQPPIDIKALSDEQVRQLLARLIGQ